MRRLAVIVGLIVAVGLLLLYQFAWRSGGNWRQVTLAFSGYTNSVSGRVAVISIRNSGPVPVVLRESFQLEYVGITPTSPVTGSTNVIRLIPTGTNLVIAPSSSADFLLSEPTEGQRWIAHLEFAPAGVRTKIGENLIRRHDWWATNLPGTVRGVPVHTMSQPFSK